MGKLVSIIGASHNPWLARMTEPKPDDPIITSVRAAFDKQREALEKAKPDVLLCLGNDHFGQLFMDNMPAFLVGKAPLTKGTFPWEHQWNAPNYSAETHTDLAMSIIRGGFENGVDFAYSDEFTIDHAFTLPLTFLRPQKDLPLVAVFANVMAPPLPPARRFHEVGSILGKIIREYPEDVRVAVICSGHMSTEVGGPREMHPDPEFDTWSMNLLGEGLYDEAIAGLTPERLWKAGNYTNGFLVFVMLMGLAQNAKADVAELLDLKVCRLPFLRWDLYAREENAETPAEVSAQ